MRRAREAILARGGAAKSNVFTRVLLALFGVIAWRAVPVMPVEIMLLPSWFPFHLDKISYWARTVIVPLLVLQALKPKARNPKGVGIDELFLAAAEDRRTASQGAASEMVWFLLFRGVDAVLRLAEPHFPKRTRRRAIDKAVAFVTERLNGEDGLGAIFPAMANSVDDVRRARLSKHDHPDYVTARASIDKLLVVKDGRSLLPALRVAGVGHRARLPHAAGGRHQARSTPVPGLEWLRRLQVLDVRGDWIARRPDVRPGGWAFQYANPHYPDLDDTAVVVMAMDRAQDVCGGTRFQTAIDRGHEWICGLQSKQRRLGRVRRRQRISLPQQHPVRRSRRAARSADRGPDRPLRLDARAARRAAGNQPGGARTHSTICAARSSPTAAGTAAGA